MNEWERVLNRPTPVFAALCALTTIAFLLRMHNLGWQCLLVDEIVTQNTMAMSFLEITRWSLSVDYNPPGYYLAAKLATVVLWDTSAFVIRLPAAIFGSLTIPAMYLLGKEVRGKTLGVLMAGLSIFLFPMFYYSQNARAYSMVLLFFTLFLWIYVKVWNSGFNTHRIAMLGFFAAMCLWSHYYVALPIAILMVLMLHRTYPDFESWFYSVICTFAFISPMILLFDFAQFGTRTDHGIFNVLWNTPNLIAMTIVNEMLCWTWIILIPLMIYTLYRYHKDESIFVPFLLTSLIASAFLIPMAHFTAVMPRYATISIPMLLVLALYSVSVAIESQPTLEKKVSLYIITMLGMLIFNFLSIYQWLTFSICDFMKM